MNARRLAVLVATALVTIGLAAKAQSQSFTGLGFRAERNRRRCVPAAMDRLSSARRAATAPSCGRAPEAWSTSARSPGERPRTPRT